MQYIGCTTQTLSQRMAQHRSHINAKKKLTNLSTFMKELGTENLLYRTNLILLL